MALTPSDLRRRKMNLLMAMSYAAFASSKASAWSPTLLFAAGEQGAWYDPSDLDRYMSPVGSELLPTNASGWLADAATVSDISGGIRVTNTGSNGEAYKNFSTIIGKMYSYSVQRLGGTATGAYYFSNNAPNALTGSLPYEFAAASGSIKGTFVASATTTFLRLEVSTVTAGQYHDYIVSVKELTAIDTATMFQDSAGTTPVTAVEQPVGLLLDKSKGLALGAELVTNGDFSSGTTGWTASASTTLSTDAERLKVTAGSTFAWAYQALTTVIGRTYKLTYSITNGDAVGCYMYVDTAAGLSASNYNSGAQANGTYSAVFVATATTTYVKPFIQGSGKFAFYDNISVKELSGNHASQSTAASRPVLSARVNLLTYSEQFDNAAWTKSSSGTISANTTDTTDPLGGNTADKYTEAAASGAWYSVYNTTAIAVTSGLNYTFTVYLRAGTRRYVQLSFGGISGSVQTNCGIVIDTTDMSIVATGNGTLGTYVSSTRTDIGNGWYRFTATGSITSTSGYLSVNSAASGSYNINPTGSGSGTFYIWGADLRVTNVGVGLPAYQAVVTSTNYDTSGFPYYIRADGTDDRLATSAINFSGTDAVTVVAGLRKLSDAQRGTVLELTASADANNGSFHLTAPNAASATYAFESKGTALTDAVVSSAVAAPITSILTAQADISADQNILRVNGVQADSDTGDQGTGNYSNAVLYIGSRGGSTLPYNGQIYGVIVRGAASSAVEIASAELWMASKTGITL
jgi:hypothetical protein